MARKMVERPAYATDICDRLRHSRATAIAEITGGEALSRALSDIMDDAIRAMLAAVCADVGVEVNGALPDATSLAILAVGGYGRRELSPGSDFDIAFVPSEEGHPELDEVVRRIYHLLMDVVTVGAELKVGYSYRLIDDLDGLEHPTQTALLDARAVAGSQDLAHRFGDELMLSLRPAAFAHHKHEERTTAWAKFDNSVYCVEPNLKDGPGGLRDYQAAGWIARARYGIRRPDVWTELRGLGLVSDRELREVREAREFLLQVRHHLHRLTGRQNDALTGDRQEALAQAIIPPGAEVPVQAFMRRVYQAMETIHRAYCRISEACLAGPLALDRRLVVKGCRIHATDPDLLTDDPSALERIFRHFQEFGFRPGPDLEETLAGDARRQAPAMRPEALAPLFTTLLASERSAASLRLMADLGILDQALPEFADARTLAPLNVAHRHTVGEHSLRALELLERLPATVEPELNELRRLHGLIANPELLRLALLIHDVGKARPHLNHSETGAAIARAAGARLGFDSEAQDTLDFLVLRHQLMAETAQLRDMTQDQTVRAFCDAVQTVDRLRLLYLFTYADMAATNLGVWTAMAARFIEELYFRAEAALTHGLPDESKDPGFTSYRRRIKQELSTHNLPQGELDAHLALMPTSYLLNTPLEEVAEHVRAIDRLKSGSPVVTFAAGPANEYTVVNLVAYDDPQPGLLSKIAAVLFANDVETRAAQVYTREGERPIAIDTLWAQYHGGELPPVKRRDLERDLQSVIGGHQSAEELPRRRGKRLPTRVMPGIAINNDLSDRHSVVEVEGSDMRGVLYRVTRAMSEVGWDIHSARVTTLIGEARDAFYVTDARGGKVPLDATPLVERMRRDAEEETQLREKRRTREPREARRAS